jgi:hypothetical protein
MRLDAVCMHVNLERMKKKMKKKKNNKFSVCHTTYSHDDAEQISSGVEIKFST